MFIVMIIKNTEWNNAEIVDGVLHLHNILKQQDTNKSFNCSYLSIRVDICYWLSADLQSHYHSTGLESKNVRRI